MYDDMLRDLEVVEEEEEVDRDEEVRMTLISRISSLNVCPYQHLHHWGRRQTKVPVINCYYYYYY